MTKSVFFVCGVSVFYSWDNLGSLGDSWKISTETCHKYTAKFITIWSLTKLLALYHIILEMNLNNGYESVKQAII